MEQKKICILGATGAWGKNITRTMSEINPTNLINFLSIISN